MESLIAVALSFVTFLSSPQAFSAPIGNSSFHAATAEEYAVKFQAIFRTRWTRVDQVKQLSEQQKLSFKNEYVLPTLKYLYGPLTYREWGSPQRGFQADIDWSKAYMNAGKVLVPYTYRATWILNRAFLRNRDLQLPVPYTAAELQTAGWKGCTDSQTDHQTASFYWYFWDPERRGCDHKLGREYQMVKLELGAQTLNQTDTYPEYNRMIKIGPGGVRQLSMTFAFGYVEDAQDPRPETDRDAGAEQYQNFLYFMRTNAGGGFQESDILTTEYGPSFGANKIIGHRFTKIVSGVKVTASVVVAAEVDQMDLFAKSFAQDHESFFSWFGHSRVGEGFDADRLTLKLQSEPRKFSVTKDYQLIYWAGCNSYSYYTLPFFQMKISPTDPLGTKGLDIISNGLPSFFALNADNAKVIFSHLMRWQQRPSYQVIIRDLEAAGSRRGMGNVLINVLGDEDNR